ncbi:10798_t:CDS:2 [Paraglomus brasilianum]|uniref:Large ribosomal subunit protein mL49 n=1 Tax=Paraglomus brasilianum TaxID=144538 RepID=A0A9N9A850_9GLOM|nr:10798_t:CDS:2 [Paraglomus brasilianum]
MKVIAAFFPLGSVSLVRNVNTGLGSLLSISRTVNSGSLIGAFESLRRKSTQTSVAPQKNKRLGGPYPLRVVDGRNPKRIPQPYRLRGVPRLPDPPKIDPNRPIVQYPYFVERSRYGELPVYYCIKNGRTRQLTTIRRIEGNLQALRDDIVKELFPGALKGEVKINETSCQIIIKGNVRRDVMQWLYDKGF